MPIEAVEPLVSFVAANIVWFTLAVYIATVVVKLAGYDRSVLFSLSYMELASITMSAIFTFEVISPTTGFENILAKLSWGVLAYAVVKPTITFGID